MSLFPWFAHAELALGIHAPSLFTKYFEEMLVLLKRQTIYNSFLSLSLNLSAFSDMIRPIRVISADSDTGSGVVTESIADSQVLLPPTQPY